MENIRTETCKKEKWLLVLLLVFAYRQLITGTQTSPFLPTVVGSFFSYSGISLSFIYLFVIGLLYIRRADIARAFYGKGTPWIAMFYLVPGVSLYLWGHYVDVTDIIHMSLLLVAFGAARLLSGKDLTGAILPPVLILMLATPLPAVLLNQIVYPFQLWGAEQSAWLLNAVGIPALALGDMIHLAGKNLRVAESCTALGFLKWLTIFALAYVYIFQVSRLHAVLMVLVAPLIAYTVNLLRLFSMALNPKMEVLTIHTAQGIAFFMIGFLLLYATDSVLLRILGDGPKAGRGNNTDPGDNVISCQMQRRSLLTLASLFTLMILASIGLPRWSPPSAETQKPAVTLPREFGDWQQVGTPPVAYSFLGSVRYSSQLHRHYMRKNESVFLFVGSDDRLRRDRSFLSDKNGYHGRIGLVEERSMVDLGGLGLYPTSILMGDGLNRSLVYYWYQGVSSVGKEILYALLALDQSPFRRTETALVVRVSTPVLPSPQGEKQAKKRLLEFLAEIKIAELNSTASKKKGPNTRFGPSPDL